MLRAFSSLRFTNSTTALVDRLALAFGEPQHINDHLVQSLEEIRARNVEALTVSPRPA